MTKRSTKHAKSTLTRLGIAALISFFGFSAAHAQEAATMQQPQLSAEQQQQLVALQEEYAELEQKIQTVQAQALETEEVKAEQRKYQEAIQTEIAKVNPEAAQLMTRQQGLYDEIVSSDELAKAPAEQSPEFQQKLQEYQQINAQVAPLSEQVASSGEVTEVREKFEETLLSEMEKINPETPTWIQARNDIVERYRNIMEQQGS